MDTSRIGREVEALIAELGFAPAVRQLEHSAAGGDEWAEYALAWIRGRYDI